MHDYTVIHMRLLLDGLNNKLYETPIYYTSKES